MNNKIYKTDLTILFRAEDEERARETAERLIQSLVQTDDWETFVVTPVEEITLEDEHRILNYDDDSSVGFTD